MKADKSYYIANMCKQREKNTSRTLLKCERENGYYYSFYTNTYMIIPSKIWCDHQFNSQYSACYGLDRSLQMHVGHFLHTPHHLLSNPWMFQNIS